MRGPNSADASTSLDVDADAVALVQSILGHVCASLTVTADQTVLAQGRDQITALDIKRTVNEWLANSPLQPLAWREGWLSVVCTCGYPVYAAGRDSAADHSHSSNAAHLSELNEFTYVEEDDSDVRTDDSEEEEEEVVDPASIHIETGCV